MRKNPFVTRPAAIARRLQKKRLAVGLCRREGEGRPK
jgi:hypothetical protein